MWWRTRWCLSTGAATARAARVQTLPNFGSKTYLISGFYFWIRKNVVAEDWFTTTWTLPSFQPRRRPCAWDVIWMSEHGFGLSDRTNEHIISGKFICSDIMLVRIFEWIDRTTYKYSLLNHCETLNSYMAKLLHQHSGSSGSSIGDDTSFGTPPPRDAPPIPTHIEPRWSCPWLSIIRQSVLDMQMRWSAYENLQVKLKLQISLYARASFEIHCDC